MPSVAKIKLTDDERSRIRWSSTKRGYVVWTEPHRGPRGGTYRPVRSAAVVVLDAAIEQSEREWSRWKPSARTVTIFEVDALGNVVDAIACDRPTAVA